MEGMGLPTGFGNSSKATHETKTAKKPMSIRLKTKDTTGFGTSTAGNAPAADQMGSRTSNTHGSSSSGESDEDDDTGGHAPAQAFGERLQQREGNGDEGAEEEEEEEEEGEEAYDQEDEDPLGLPLTESITLKG